MGNTNNKLNSSSRSRWMTARQSSKPSPLTTISSYNHQQDHQTATTTPSSSTINNTSSMHEPIFPPSSALIGIGAASSSHSNILQPQNNTPSSPVLSSSINTSFIVYPLQHVDSDMTSLASCTTTQTSRRNSRTNLSSSIIVQPTGTNVNTFDIGSVNNYTSSTNINSTLIHTNSNITPAQLGITTITTSNMSNDSLHARQSLPPPLSPRTSPRLPEKTGYRRSLSTPKLSLLKKKNVIKAFFMLHRRNTLNEAEMQGESDFARRITDSEEYIPMQNVKQSVTPIVREPIALQQYPTTHRPRVHSMTMSAVSSSDSYSSGNRGIDFDTDTTVAAEKDEKKKIANILNKSFGKTRAVIKSQSHAHVEEPSTDHGKLPDRKGLERSASAPQIMTNELETLLRDAMGFQLFKDFCIAEYSVENLNCWQELLDMEKNFIDMSGKRRSTIINMVYDKFLDDGSSEEINIRGKTKKLVDQERKSGTINLDISKVILHEIKRDLYTNLVDSFSRFIHTEEYRLWHELKTNPANVFE